MFEVGAHVVELFKFIRRQTISGPREPGEQNGKFDHENGGLFAAFLPVGLEDAPADSGIEKA